MKRKLFGTLLAAALVVTSAVTAFAAGSKTAAPTLVGDSVGKYEVKEITVEAFPELAESKPEVIDVILNINAGTASVDKIAEQAPELKEQLEGKSLVSKFVDITALDAATKTEDGKYQVTLSVPGLTDAESDVLVLHYSTVRNVWETITPSNVDVANKQLTAEFEDLSPVAVIAKVDAAKAAGTTTGTTTGTATSPKTGVASDWAVFMGAAVVLLGASVFAFAKSGKRA